MANFKINSIDKNGKEYTDTVSGDNIGCAINRAGKLHDQGRTCIEIYGWTTNESGEKYVKLMAHETKPGIMEIL